LAGNEIIALGIEGMKLLKPVLEVEEEGEGS
jgi:hypothetical protein